MIKLTKSKEPEILQKNRVSWEKTLFDHAASGTEPTQADLNRYNHPDIKSALLAETGEKCAYCESKIRHITYGDIEHIVPKRLAPEHRFKWDNLTIGCDTCNTKKGIKENLIDPYRDDPETEFVVMGPMLLPDPQSDRAKVTESALDLNRKALMERRAERIKALHSLVQIALSLKEEGDQKVLFDEIRLRETTDEVEYAALSRSYVRELQAKGIIPSE
ncbi:HNH endonuclease [Sinorhizobium meliloti]|uniref:HNH endonuclease n=1 Tax=Rhizobium meliloti TaxID=382 RepID=UPI0037048888